MTFQDRLQSLRQEAGFTQREAALKADLPYRTYQNYEMGIRSPVLTNLIALAKLYSVSLDYLAGLTDER